MVRIKEMFE